MKTATHIPQTRRFPARSVLAGLALVALSAASLWAENVFVTAYKGLTATTDLTPCPPSCADGTVSGSGSAASSSASPAPIIPSSGRRVRFGYGDGCSWSVTPTDIDLVPESGSPTYHFTQLQHTPGVYALYVTKGTSGNASPDLVVQMTATGGDLSDTNGVGAAAIDLPVFQAGYPNNVWIPVGFITNNIPNPTITFTAISGVLASAGGRWYMDAVWFEYLEPCRGVAPQVGITGPLMAGQTYVNVIGVAEGASNVTVYADNVLIGSTNYAAGFAAGQVTVPTSPLVKGAIITATETKTNLLGGACTSDPGPSGIVGGGPNASVTAFITCWKNPAYAGPIGADSIPPSSGFPYFLKATNTIASYNTAPVGGTLLTPSLCWQTAIFQNGVDDGIDLNSNAHVSNTDPFCSLEGLAFSIDAGTTTGDTGPYEIYVDSIMNGDTLVEGFEDYTPGEMATFNTPYAANQPNSASTYLTAPNSSSVSDRFAFEGTKSYRIEWQFADGNNVRWAHVRANAGTGKTYPQLDTTKPIIVRYLVLPVGGTVDHKFNGTVGQISGNTPAYETGTNTLQVSVTGTGTYTYQWSWDGVDIDGATTSSLVVGDWGLHSGMNGTYRVAVSDGTCTETRSALLTVEPPVPTFTNQPTRVLVNVGGTASFTASADGHVPLGYPLFYQWRLNGNDLPGETTETLVISDAQIWNAGYYELFVQNNYGMATSIAAPLDVVPAGVIAGTGNGLRSDYYTQHTNDFTGSPTLTRIDPVIDFSWGTMPPAPGISADYFTVRWTGQIEPLGEDTYTFYTSTDDGVRLYIDNQLIIDQWIPQAETEWSGMATLTPGKHDLVMEYFEGGVTAAARLSWSTASGSIMKQIIPTSQLYAPLLPPTMGYTQQGSNLIFTWDGPFSLQSATNVAGPYITLPPATSPYTNNTGDAPEKFFRLINR